VGNGFKRANDDRVGLARRLLRASFAKHLHQLSASVCRAEQIAVGLATAVNFCDVADEAS
jgi:hypothetical protein